MGFRGLITARRPARELLEDISRAGRSPLTTGEKGQTKMTQKFPIREIATDRRCQARKEEDPAIVDEYADAYRAKAKFPPIEVFIVDGAPQLVDGWHRLAAMLKAGLTWVTCEVVGTGTIDEAVWRALGANQGHGIRRTNEDKRRAVRLALESPIGNEQSARVLAEHIGVSHELVLKVRGEWEAERRAQLSTPDSCEPAEPVKRIGKDGRARSAPKPRAPKAEVQTPDSCEPEPVAVDYPVEDDVPLPHEPEAPTVGMPPHGPELLRCAGLIAKLRVSLRSAALPNGTLQTIESELKLTEHRLRGGVPEVCPRCNGAKCNRCQNRGWVERCQADGMRAGDKVLGR